MTSVAVLPENSKRCLDDPFADKKSKWKCWIAGIIVIALAVFYFLPDTVACKASVKTALGLPLNIEAPKDCPKDATASGTAQVTAEASATPEVPASENK